MKKALLKNYAELLVKMGVNVQKGQELNVYASIDQVPLVTEVVKWAYKVGAKKVNVEWGCQEVSKLHYKYRTLETLSTVENWEVEKMKHRVEALPARLLIVSDDPDGMKGVDQKKIAMSRRATYPIMKPFIDQIENKEQWCIAGASSSKWAKKVFPHLSKSKAVEALWDAIFTSSRVDGHAIENWEKHNDNLTKKCDYLNSLKLKELRYTSSNGTNLKVGLIENAVFMGGNEKALGSNIIFNPNIPSEEIFTTPKKGLAEGIVYSAKPLSYQGQLIENFSVRFENGKAVEVKAEKGEELLKEMISMDETAGYLGEVALIAYDSPINNTGLLFFETLYDENASCHLALGRGFSNCIKDYEKYTKEEIDEMGINDSMIHVDFMIGSKDMSIVGITSSGEEIQIFKDGNWAF
ncbi:MAG: aminopeptidase [Erysipelotrichaceae bacterium]|nr:aminopeptidase [Erysipelotrichaceae bacterium]